MSNILTLGECSRLVEEVAEIDHGVVVYCHGTYDYMHYGHISQFKEAAKLGDILVVGITADEYINRGPGKPVFNHEVRAGSVEALECVDYVTIFEEDTAAELIELLKPDLQVKGGTTPVVVEREIVEAYGGKVVTLEKIEGPSTTAIINRILEANQERRSSQ